MGVMYYESKGVQQDYNKAYIWYRKAADKGNAAAMGNMGVMYGDGLGVQRDYNKAVSWYRKAAEKGNVASMYNLAAMYFDGRGVQRDYAKAYIWVSVAVAFGDKESEKPRDRLASKLTHSARQAAQSRATELFKKISGDLREQSFDRMVKRTTN